MATADALLLQRITEQCISLQDEVLDLTSEIKSFVKETDELLLQQQETPPNYSKSKYTIVQKSDLECLKSEAIMMKEFLPAVLKPALSMIPQLTQAEQELVFLRKETEKLNQERDGLVHKAEGYLVDYEQEKEEKFELRCSLTEANHQLEQQVDYCSSLGSVCGTLLWRTSQNEECIHNLLSGSKVNEFLQLVVSTLHSYLSTYGSSLPSYESQEAQFVLSLCGTVTNIAASAYGREYLSTSTGGQQLIENMCDILGTAPLSKECAKIKSLILMLLYNISINQKGLTFLRSMPNLLRILGWLIKEEVDNTIVLYSVQLLQSIILEPISPTLVTQVIEAITPDVLEKCVSSSCEELKQVACELALDIQRFHKN